MLVVNPYTGCRGMYDTSQTLANDFKILGLQQNLWVKTAK